MKAVVIDEWGGSLAIRDIPIPEPQRGEVQIKIQAAGVNPFDWAIRMGTGAVAQMPHQFPITLGRDFAGTVERLGEGVSRFQPGEPVVGQVRKSELHDGSYAEYVTMPEAGPLVRQPSTISPPEAAALPTPGTAALAAVDAVNPQPGQTVLVVGATGGVGGYATQLVAGAGARVIATALPNEADYVRRLGAEEVIDYRQEDVAQALRAAHPDGIDALINAAYRPAEFGALVGATLRSGGQASSTITWGWDQIDVEGLARRQITVIPIESTVSNNTLERLGQLVEKGRLRVPLLTCLPLEEAPRAMEQFRSGHVRGKIVLLPNAVS